MPTAASVLRRTGASLALAALAACSGSTGGGKTNVAFNLATGDIPMGSDTAPVTLVEYGSLTCSHCRDFWKQALPVIKANYIDTGKVKFIFREFPTAPPEVSIAASAIARCAGKDKYYAVIDDVYTSQYDLLMAAQQGTARNVLIQIAGRHGVSAEQVQACAVSKEMAGVLDKIQKETPVQVTGTPTLVIGKERIEDHSPAGLSAALDKALGGAPAAPTPASGAAGQ